MAGVTRTRGSTRANHSIDATPPAAAPAPAEPQSLLGYMASRLYTPAAGAETSGVHFSPAVETPQSSCEASEILGSSAVANEAPGVDTVAQESKVADALREIAEIDRRRSALESVLLQAEGGGPHAASAMDPSTSVPGTNTGRLISHLISDDELIVMARSLAQDMSTTAANEASSFPSVGALLRSLDANFDRHPHFLQQEIERGLVQAIITTMETHDIRPSTVRHTNLPTSSPAVTPASASPMQSMVDGVNAAATEQFEAFLRSEDFRNSRETRDGEQEVHVPIPEDGVDYGEDEYDPNVTMLEDFQPDPQELLHALQQGISIHDGTSILDPATEIPRLQAILQYGHSPTTQPRFKIAVPSAHTTSSFGSVGSSSSTRSPPDPEGFLAGASSGNLPESAEVRSVLQCNTTGAHMILLHPCGTCISYAPSGFPLLVFPDGCPVPGIEITRATSKRLRHSTVLTHGNASGAVLPTPDDLAHAPFLNRRPRLPFSYPRAVRYYVNGPCQVEHCDWSQESWTAFRDECLRHQPAPISSTSTPAPTGYRVAAPRALDASALGGGGLAVPPLAGQTNMAGVANVNKLRRPKKRDSLYAEQVLAATPGRRPSDMPSEPTTVTTPSGWTYVQGPPPPPARQVQVNVTGLPVQHRRALAARQVPSSTSGMPSAAQTGTTATNGAGMPTHLSKLIGELSKLSEFSGAQSDFKAWCQELWRVAAVNGLEETLDPSCRPGHVAFDPQKNKVLYYLIEKAVEHSVIAHSHFKKASRFDGNAAYFVLREAYVFSGQAEAALLLQKLNGFRLQSGELLVTFCTRLSELFEDLESLEGENAMEFSPTQKLMYLLNAIADEPDLAAAHVYLQSEMNRGTMTFDLAMRDLQLRCETQRANTALKEAAPAPLSNRGRRAYAANPQEIGMSARQSAAEPYKPTEEEWMATRELECGTDIDAMDTTQMKALVTTVNKRLHQAKSAGGAGVTNSEHATPCLVKGCEERCSLPICRLHFASMVCGKTPVLPLKNDYGEVKYDKVKHQAVYPPAVPADKLKKIVRNPKRPFKGTQPKKE